MSENTGVGSEQEQLNGLWTRALEIARDRAGVKVFHLWIEPLEPVSLVDGELLLETPDHFFSGWVKNHYGDLLLDSLKSVSGGVERIAFRSQERGPVPAETRPAPDSGRTEEPYPAPPPVRKTENLPGERLNERYSFDNFVIGDGNQLAHAAALSVTRAPGKAYNPFFIYGPVGVGKTHLMQAIGASLRDSNLRVAYISSERFLNDYISSLQNRCIQDFRNRFRELDLLLIDDIQFIGGKEETQKEFFHTFNALYDEHKQVVLSCDRSPNEIRDIEQRLVSRFEWGLVVDINLPDFETRAAIIKKKAEAQNFALTDEVVFCLAENIEGNIRTLEGALNRLVACAGLYEKKEVDVSFTRDILRDIFRGQDKKRLLTVPRIMEKVAEHYQARVSDIRGNRRNSELMIPRQVAIYLSRALTGNSLPSIGQFFGGRNHTTILYACRKIEEKMATDAYFKEEIDRLTVKIKSDTDP